MPDVPRELLQAAQAAELQGDTAQAILLLTRAAGLYDVSGASGQAERMRRHAARLAPLQISNSSPLLVAPKALETTGAERGPLAADPSRAAWCSFCCRPATEVGRLVQGATDAFICAACIALATGIRPSIDTLKLSESEPAAELVRLSAQEDLVRLEGELHAGPAFAVVIGPVASGKSAWLARWEALGLGRRWKPEEPLPMPANTCLLVDDVQRLATAERVGLAERIGSRAFVLMLGLDGVAAPETAPGGNGIWASVELERASGGVLPRALCERVTTWRTLGKLQNPDLALLATHWMELLLGSGQAPERVCPEPIWLEWAQSSGRGAHELKALCQRAAHVRSRASK